MHAGFLHDAEKEVVEARLTAALVAARPLPDAAALAVDPTSWMRGLAEAASELRRHLLDRLRDGEVDRAEALLAAMDEVYGALVTVDYPDALTSGLRRTLDALRSVLERSRGDVTTTVLQTRLQRAIEATSGGGLQPTRACGNLTSPYGGVAQLARALRSHRRGRGFDSHHLHQRTKQLTDVGRGVDEAAKGAEQRGAAVMRARGGSEESPSWRGARHGTVVSAAVTVSVGVRTWVAENSAAAQ